MLVIYSPAGETPREYDAEGLTCGEADAVCRVLDTEWALVGQALRNQDPGAMRAVAWAWEKRAQPTLRFGEFDPPLRAVKARFATDEIPDFLDLVDRNPGFSDAERARARAEVVAMAVDPDAARAAVEAHDTPPKEAPAPAPSDSYAMSTTG